MTRASVRVRIAAGAALTAAALLEGALLESALRAFVRQHL